MIVSSIDGGIGLLCMRWATQQATCLSFNLECGSAQMAMRLEQGGYLAASDHRKDGYAVGM